MRWDEIFLGFCPSETLDVHSVLFSPFVHLCYPLLCEEGYDYRLLV